MAMIGKSREAQGQSVRQLWINFCEEIGDSKPGHLAPWEELSENDKEVDRRIGEELYRAGYERARADVLNLINGYMLVKIFDDNVADTCSYLIGLIKDEIAY